MQEFPKMLYRGEQTTIVADKDAEAAKRSDGWHDFGKAPKAQAEDKASDDKTGQETRRARQPKAQAED